MIEKDNMQVAPTQPLVTLERPVGKDFQLNDVFPLIKRGVEAIVDDDFTKRFAAEELASWNLLTRTNKNYQFIRYVFFVLSDHKVMFTGDIITVIIMSSFLVFNYC